MFFAIAQSFGAFGPWLYGMLIGNGQDHFKLFIGYLIGAGVMVIGGVVEVSLGVAAEGKSLEDVALPLSAVNKDSTSGKSGAPSSTPPSTGRRALTAEDLLGVRLALDIRALRSGPTRNSLDEFRRDHP